MQLLYKCYLVLKSKDKMFKGTLLALQSVSVSKASVLRVLGMKLRHWPYFYLMYVCVFKRVVRQLSLNLAYGPLSVLFNRKI